MPVLFNFKNINNIWDAVYLAKGEIRVNFEATRIKLESS